MRRILLLAASLFSLSVSGQQLSSSIPGAHGDQPNVLIANPQAVGLTNDLRAVVWLDNDGIMKFRNVAGKGYAFRNHANNADMFVIDENARVGIGVVPPRGKLHVSGPIDGSVSTIRIGHGHETGNLNVPFGAATGGYNIDFETWRDIVPGQVGARIRGERINNWLNNSALKQSVDLVFSTSGGTDESELTEKLRIRADGNVGIGTPNPLAKLGVNGLIRATEVKVESSIWPDYVFADEYKLYSLADVKKYIKENHHLPGIPSAAQIKAEGLSLGEMNRLLAQKIEELTLYAIEKEESDQQKNDLINSQKKRIESLEERLDKMESLLKGLAGSGDTNRKSELNK